MSIQLRFALLTATVTAALLLGLTMQDRADRQEATQIHQALERERERLIENLLETTGERLRVFAGDYAPWDEMLAFVSDPNPDWVRTNINEPIATQQLDAAWVFRPDFTPVHAALREGSEAIGAFPLSPEVLRRIAIGLDESHCFVPTGAGLLELRGAPIRPSDRNVPVTAAGGWLFVGQLWNETYLNRLSLLTGAEVAIVSPHDAPAPADPLTVVNYRVLRDWRGQPLHRIRFSYTPAMLERMHARNRTGWLLFASFGGVTLAAYFFAIRRWVLRPVSVLGASLQRRDPAPLDRLHGASREFDALARLVRDSFAHEQTLRQVFAAFNAIDDAVFIVDARDGKITGVNSAALRLLGTTREDLLGRSLDELRVGAGSAARPDAANASLPPFVNQGLRHRDGRCLEVEISEPPATAAGDLRLRVVVARDVTERRRLEQLRLRAQRMESIGTLAGGVAHDLNNMLTPVTLLLDQLQRDGQVPGPEMLAGVRSSVRRSAAMLRQLLAFGRGLEGERRPLTLARPIEDIGRIVDSTFPKSIRFIADIPDRLWTVSGDATQLHQVLLNLCVNARDAMPDGGSLTVRAANLTLDADAAVAWPELTPGRHVLIEVTDTGSGIAPEHLERIFEPFFTTKDVEKGTGLGLSTTLTIVRSHGGAIRVDSQPGHGTTFRIALPAREGAAESIQAETNAAFRGAGRTVLVVDDEAPVRDFIAALLPRFSLKVLLAANVDAGLETYHQHAGGIDLLITDLQMPQRDGRELIRLLHTQAPTLPVIAMSGRIEDSVRAELDRSGVVVLGKPFEVAELVAVLRRTLG